MRIGTQWDSTIGVKRVLDVFYFLSGSMLIAGKFYLFIAGVRFSFWLLDSKDRQVVIFTV